MLHILVLAAAFALAAAQGIAEWQKPLPQPPGAANCGRGRKAIHIGSSFTFQMNGDWRYYFTDYFPSDWHCDRGEVTQLHLNVFDDITNRIAPINKDPYSKGPPKAPKNQQSSLMMTLPLDTEASGPLVLEPEPGWKLFHHMDTSIDIVWTPTKQPGRRLNVTSINVSKGVSVSASTGPISLALHTPYIRLPHDVYDFMAKFTQPEAVDMGRGMDSVDIVSCNATSTFPTLNLDFEGGAQQILVKPAQYVLRVSQSLGGPFKGKCVLLAKRGGELEIGYAALRGRSVWFDWANARTGFQA
ncbi:hypothetical protein DPSP01_005820 [Paraphaeosphaeria sporulosa]|uniref:Peptidase A1 domain-containing protein n=1 Tax=Paraphaeosphaeria sporulosa TaxID=1460663 RepID=A0A177CCC0_9PLEO|nr:uncharacterized protein CC84DRAFT_1164917 [Paraphaeosphaeria sporulosa]OAG04449.1 hypothetical protein CC84DRAFT_1164917 [Paraphaeosphaeria sporulosa]